MITVEILTNMGWNVEVYQYFSRVSRRLDGPLYVEISTTSGETLSKEIREELRSPQTHARLLSELVCLIPEKEAPVKKRYLKPVQTELF